MEVITKKRQVGGFHAMALQVKKTLEQWGECGIACMDNPDDMLSRLKALGVEATAEPTYRTMSPMLKHDEFGRPIDVVVGEKVKTGYVFKINKTTNQ